VSAGSRLVSTLVYEAAMRLTNARTVADPWRNAAVITRTKQEVMLLPDTTIRKFFIPIL